MGSRQSLHGNRFGLTLWLQLAKPELNALAGVERSCL
jgi:hypothetical protein